VHTELLPAIRAVLEDKYFVSGILDRQLSKAAQRSSVRHEVQFYSQDAALLESFTDFVADTLTDNKAAIVIASESHRAGVLQGLNRQKMDVDGAIKSGVLIPLDVAETSATFIRDHGDPARFFETAAGLIEAATKAVKGKKTPNVAICREPPPSWLAEGEVERTLKLERLWSEFAHSCVMDLLCGYSLASLANHDDVFQGICAEHSVIFSH
jgi:hypothetical protein